MSAQGAAVVKVPITERATARVVARALVWLGKRAWDRGDIHEYQHARAALMAGACDEECNPRKEPERWLTT